MADISNARRQEVAHLLRRAGFGAAPAEIDALAALDHSAAVERLLNPPNALAPDAEFNFERLMADAEYNPTLLNLQEWWLNGLVATTHSLREKMVVFWHGHFATGFTKVDNAVYMLNQNQLLRRHALGNFKTLVKAITRDPAMMVYLDSQTNNKARPNENYARELMELFTIGISNYSETDVREAARAFTGLGIKGEGVVTYNERDHDTGTKNFMGKSGNFAPDDIIDIILARKETASFIATKLWRFFVSQDVPQAAMGKVADALYSSSYDISTALRTVFTAPEFLAKETYYAQIKSPVELIVGTLRTLGAVDVEQRIALQISNMGQALFQPPTVKGWDGGQKWLNSTTFFDRVNFANSVASARANQPARFDLAAFFGNSAPSSGDNAVDAVLARVLPNATISSESRAALVGYTGSLTPAAINGAFALTGGATQQTEKPNPTKTPAAKANPTKDAKQGSQTAQPGAQQPNQERQAEGKLRGLIHLAMSLPEYQLN